MARNAACLPEQLCCRGLERPSRRGTLQQICTQSRLPENVEGGAGVGDVTTMGGTGNGQLLLLEVVLLRCAGENQEAGLEGLEG